MTNDKGLLTDIEVKTAPLTHGHMISPIYKQLCTTTPVANYFLTLKT